MTAHNILDFNTALTQAQLDERTRRQSVSAEDVRNRVHGQAQGFVEWLFSGRALCHRGEARIGDVYGTPGASLSIQLTGKDAGLWHDHATGQGGDLIGLYMDYMGQDRSRDFPLALREIASTFLGDPVEVSRDPWRKPVTERIEEKKQKLGTKPRAEHLDLGPPVASWKYRDLAGNIMASVERYEPDGTPASKTYRPWCFKVIDGERKWVKGAPELRPLYNLAGIAAASVVVLVEGEKCAQALIDIGVDATTAMQGAEAPIERTDWSALNGKTVIIWPDNDGPGFAYARKAAERLTALGCQIRMVQIPSGAAEKWDSADCLAEGGDARALIHTAVPLAAKARPRITMLTIDELWDLPEPTYRIQKTLTDSGLSMVWGASGSMKSFVALDMSLCIATGRPWHGKAVKQGPVVYVAAEGARGLAARALGWWQNRAKDGPKPDFILIPHPVALTTDDLDALLEAISTLAKTPVLVVFDTLARTFGPGDENRQMDMNAYVTAAGRLQETTGAHVMVVHHSGKDADRGERGSNVLRGAADTIIKIARTGDKIDVINKAPDGKMKDDEEFETVKLRSQQVAYHRAGVEKTTLILNVREDEGDDEDAQQKPERKLGKVQEAVLKALRKAGEPLGQTRLLLMTSCEKGALFKATTALIEKELIVDVPADGINPRMWRLP